MTTRNTELFPSKWKLQENDAFIFVSFKSLFLMMDCHDKALYLWHK